MFSLARAPEDVLTAGLLPLELAIMRIGRSFSGFKHDAYCGGDRRRCGEGGLIPSKLVAQ